MLATRWRKWVQRAFDNGRRRAQRRRHCRPSLEALEPRVVPSFATATGSTIAPTEGAAFSGTVASFTTSTPGDNFTASIDWGDGTTNAGTIASTGPGSFNVTGSHTYADEFSALAAPVTIKDTTDSTQVTPTATANVAEGDSLSAVVVTTGTISENQFVGGEAAAFSDSNASAQASDFTGTFDWGDGTTYSTGAGTATVTKGSDGNFTLSVSGHTYADEGTYTVKATLADDSPGTATLTQTGTLTAAEADTLTPQSATITPTEGSAFSGAVATFTDSGYPNNSPSDFTATIDWGDGTTDSGAAVTITGGSGTFTVSGGHTYADEGTFNPVVTLADDAPGTASATATSTANVAEGDSGNLNSQTITPTEGSAFSGTVATFTDSGNPSQVASDFTASIDWGDGTTTTGTVSGATGGPFSISGSHTYADEGTFTVLASFSDDPPSTLTGITITSTANVAEGDSLAATSTQPSNSATEGTATGTIVVATFTNSGYSGNPSSDFTATIDWGDGTTDRGAAVTITGGSGTFTVSGGHTYADEGTFHPVVTLADDSPGTASATATGTVTVAEADTLAATGTPLSGTAPEGAATGTIPVATFTDSGYPNNSPSDFTATIDWGDGTTDSGAAVTITGGSGTFTVSGGHSYADEGTFHPVVTLADDTPGTASATTTGTVTVTESDSLTVSAGTVNASEAVPLSNAALATFTTTYAGATASDFTATILWGDGTSATGTITGNTGGPFTVSGSHFYADEGTFTDTVLVNDDAPGTATGQSAGTVSVAEADTLTLAATALAPTEGTAFTGSVATFTDAGYPSNVPTDFSATIDWGDGTTTSGTVVGLGGGHFSVQGTHTYADEGTFHPVVTVSDDPVGTASATATGTATVVEGDTLSNGAIIFTPKEGGFSGAVATFADSNTANGPGDFTAIIVWGDGTTDTGSSVTVSGGGGSFTVSGSHSYADEGAQVVRVTLSDDAPGTATLSTSATVQVGEADTLSGTGQALAPTATESFSGTVATFSDSGYPANKATDFTATIDWGDGTSSAGTVTGGGGNFTVAGGHTYAQSGSFTTHVTLKDDSPGTATATAVGSSSVAPAPVVTPGPAAPLTGFEFAPLTGVTVATFSFANHATPASAFRATIDWGDGTSSAGTITGSGGSFTVVGSHTYQDEGNYTVVTTITGGPSPVAIPLAARIGEEQVLQDPAYQAQVLGVLEGAGIDPGTANAFLALLLNDGPNLRFLTEAYRDLLGRQIDPLGLVFWGLSLDGGLTSTLGVTMGIASTPEFQARLPSFLGNAFQASQQAHGGPVGDLVFQEVDGLYELLLHRSAQGDTFANVWGLQLQAGIPPAAVVAEIASTDEFFAKTPF